MEFLNQNGVMIPLLKALNNMKVLLAKRTYMNRHYFCIVKSTFQVNVPGKEGYFGAETALVCNQYLERPLHCNSSDWRIYLLMDISTDQDWTYINAHI